MIGQHRKGHGTSTSSSHKLSNFLCCIIFVVNVANCLVKRVNALMKIKINILQITSVTHIHTLLRDDFIGYLKLSR